MAGEAYIMRASAVWSWAAGATMTTSPSTTSALRGARCTTPDAVYCTVRLRKSALS